MYKFYLLKFDVNHFNFGFQDILINFGFLIFRLDFWQVLGNLLFAFLIILNFLLITFVTLFFFNLLCFGLLSSFELQRFNDSCVGLSCHILDFLWFVFLIYEYIAFPNLFRYE